VERKLCRHLRKKSLALTQKFNPVLDTGKRGKKEKWKGNKILFKLFMEYKTINKSSAFFCESYFLNPELVLYFI